MNSPERTHSSIVQLARRSHICKVKFHLVLRVQVVGMLCGTELTLKRIMEHFNYSQVPTKSTVVAILVPSTFRTKARCVALPQQ